MNGLLEAFLSLLYPENVACCICGEEACVNEEGLCASCAAGIRRCTLLPALRFADGFAAGLIGRCRGEEVECREHGFAR